MVWLQVKLQVKLKLQIRFVGRIPLSQTAALLSLKVLHSDLEANQTIPSNNGPVEVLVEALNLNLPLVVEALLTPRLPATEAVLVGPSLTTIRPRATGQTTGPASREAWGSTEGRVSLRRPWDSVWEPGS